MDMSEAVIAVIFDFDGTLGVDTIYLLLKANNMDPDVFWGQVDAMVESGWDPPLAYMHLLLQYSKNHRVELTREMLTVLGADLVLFPGLPGAFSELREYALAEKELKGLSLKLEFYIISGGIEEMIRGNGIAREMDGIFACNFAYDAQTKEPVGIKSTVSFTEKTRYVYGISKGLSASDLRRNPYSINNALPDYERRIPLSHMIYIGDGPSDIPCLSAITREGGTGIGVSAPTLSFKKGYELARGKRITVGPYTANYLRGSDMRKVLEETILRMGLEIRVNQKKHVISAPDMG
jgi:phosphoglycolate phosphatase-like HAD superfamily hydrolase